MKKNIKGILTDKLCDISAKEFKELNCLMEDAKKAGITMKIWRCIMDAILEGADAAIAIRKATVLFKGIAG